MYAPSCRVFLFSLCILPLSVYSVSNEDFESFKLEMNHLRSRQDDLEGRVDKLEELAKIGTLRTCAEYAQYGLKTSGLYMIDPDGPLLGQPPFQVFCDFKSGSTEVMHDTENLTVVEHCHDPGCYEKSITYSYPDADGQSRVPVPMTQIESLIQLSDFCDQEFLYDCTLAPLSDEDVDFAYWEDRYGNKNNYFTGSNYGNHVCDCHYEAAGCMEEETKGNTCNCDANLPVALTDSGTITNSTALPMVKLYFGGLTYEIQYATYTLGRLKCYGAQNVDVGTSCSSLKQSGYFKSGYYNIEEDNSKKVVFCDMTSDSYEDVPQSDEIVLSTIGSPVGTILAWTMKVETTGTEAGDIPDGWMRCDGSVIPPPSVWAGQKTPDLNNGKRFLRGGLDSEVLTLEEDQMQDHKHDFNDPGHTHPYEDNYMHSYHYMQISSHHDYDHRGAYNPYSDDKTTSSRHTGVTVTGVSSSYRHGDETRPKNMNVIYIIRVY